MDKKEFEKVFKVGDSIQYYEYSHPITLKFIGYLGFYCESKAYGSDDFNFNDYDLSDFKKVEPVKKWWKHAFIDHSDQIIIRYYSHKSKQAGYEYIKEPIEITLEDI